MMDKFCEKLSYETVIFWFVI